MGKTCLNRLIGRCEDTNRGGECKKDYDTAHHPNNYDCPNYHEATIIERTFGRNGRLSYRILEKKS